MSGQKERESLTFAGVSIRQVKLQKLNLFKKLANLLVFLVPYDSVNILCPSSLCLLIPEKGGR